MLFLRMTARQQLAVCLAAVTLAATAAGCGDGGGGDGPRVVDKVTYLTGFGAFGREGFAWVAREKGYFRAQGLDVDVQPGAAGEKNLQLLASGRAQFALVDYAGVVVRAGHGRFDQFRLVGAVNDRTLISLMTLDGTGITRPADLAGKRIGQAAGAVPKTLFPTYARLAGIDPETVSWVETSPQGLPALLASGRVDAVGQFVVGQPAIAAAAGGRRVVVFPYGDYLTDLYGNVVVTTAELVERDPDLVRRFVTALMQGLRYAVDHPDEAGQILHAAHPATDADTAAAELALMRAYVPSDRPSLPLGAFDRIRVARSVAAMQAAGLITGFVQPESFVDFTVMTPAATAAAAGVAR
ncbi:MAG TPA: ABC transporter substrate-binding protein [Micromonosporaceae bacterium]